MTLPEVFAARYKQLGINCEDLIPVSPLGYIPAMWQLVIAGAHLKDRGHFTFFHNEEGEQVAIKLIEQACRSAGLPKSGLTVLDVMTGTRSYLSEELVGSIRSGGKLIGLDLVKSFAHEPELDEFMLADLNSNPPHINLPDHSVDIVTLVHGIEYLTKPLEVFDEVSRVLKTGGVFVMVQGEVSYEPARTKLFDAVSMDDKEELIKQLVAVTPGFETPKAQTLLYSVPTRDTPVLAVWAFR